MAAPSARARLLVVEDDRRYALCLAELLDGMVDVEHCGSGAEASARLRRRSFDWVLLDVGLPDADGFTLTPALRREFPGLRVVLHSGAVLVDGRRRAIEAGAVDLVEKPLSLPYLRTLLES